MSGPHILQVFLTVDTEVWPNVPGWPPKVRLTRGDSAMRSRIDVDIHGKTAAGAFGVGYQLDTLKRRGLRANYFVEPLACGFYGDDYLRELVGGIVKSGHDVQLHLHTEWLSDVQDTALPRSFRQYLHEFDETEQTALIAWGARKLQTCGAAPIRAFRAGSYGANASTLKALVSNGIYMDSSYNSVYLGSSCKLPTDRVRLQPWRLDGVLEFPVSVFEDYPGHMRHAQLCACSLAEMTHALELAWQGGWHYFTILLHSFELIRNRMAQREEASPDRINIRRFEGLCEFLASNRSRFHTSMYSEMNHDRVVESPEVAPLRTGVWRTAKRLTQQAWARVG